MSSIQGLALRAFNGTNKRIARHTLPILVKFRHPELKLKALGQLNGTWVVPVDLITKDSICYCFGVGKDITFDIELAKLGAKVFCFDPTPGTIEYMKTAEYDHERITFIPVGIWNEDTQLKFHSPMDDTPNFSVRNVHGTSKHYVVECERLSTIMKKLGHDHLDLVKLDIEGAWPEVVEEILEAKIPIKVFCIEFDTPTNLFKTMRMIKRLEQCGYSPLHKDHRENFVFVNEALI